MKKGIEEIIEKRAKEIIATRKKVYIVEYVNESKKSVFTRMHRIWNTQIHILWVEKEIWVRREGRVEKKETGFLDFE